MRSATGLPLKILLQTDDILAPLADDPARASLGLCGRTLTSAAIALGEVFVLQSSASNLLRPAREAVRRAWPVPARRCSRCFPARAGTPATFRPIWSARRRWNCAPFRRSSTTRRRARTGRPASASPATRSPSRICRCIRSATRTRSTSAWPRPSRSRRPTSWPATGATPRTSRGCRGRTGTGRWWPRPRRSRSGRTPSATAFRAC